MHADVIIMSHVISLRRWGRHELGTFTGVGWRTCSSGALGCKRSRDRDFISFKIRCDELNVDLAYLSAHPREVARHSDVAWPQERVDQSLRPA